MEPVNLSGTTSVDSPPAEDRISVGGEYKPYTPLYEKFGVLNKDSERVNRNLDAIWKWAEDHAETKDKDAILWQITKLNMRLGDAFQGSAPYTKVLNYVSEYNRMREAENRLKEMEAGGRK